MESIKYLECLVRTYGYWALLAGTFLEGETILIIGGLLAKLGLLKLSTVMVIAFIGSFSGDQLYFYIGRFKGRELLKKHHKWEKRVDKIHKILERYHDLIMLGFRFVYGMRIMTPFVLGMSKQIKAIRFSILNAVGAVLWSVAISAGGYFFGYALEGFVKDVKKYEIHAVLAIFVIGAALWIVHKCIEKRTS
jgi:membrane protein DedA with SNARE-associated domain